jgi:hypothetical protein
VHHGKGLNWIELAAPHWPVVSCAVHGTPGDQEFRGFLDDVAHHLRREQVHAYVIDLQLAELPSRERREWLLQALAPQEPVIRRFVAGIALVLPETTFRFARSAMILKKRKFVPTTVHESPEAGIEWCKRQIASSKANKGGPGGRPRR